MLSRLIIVLLTIGFASCESRADDAPRQTPRIRAAPADNPLKGLVPYSHARNGGFPHSLEFDYLPLSGLVIARNRYDWTITRQAARRVRCAGPSGCVPRLCRVPRSEGRHPCVLDSGGIASSQAGTRARSDSAESITPDYNDTRLAQCIEKLHRGPRQALRRRSADRIYHRRPPWEVGRMAHLSEELNSSPARKCKLRSWTRTRRRSELPRSSCDTRPARRAARSPPNANRRFGYHDDSFAWATLDLNPKKDDWFFLAKLKKAGPQALDKWKTQPIGGEIRPEAWGRVFDERPGLSKVQDFRRCVEETHATWMMDSGMFGTASPPERWKRAEEDVRRMGYEFHVQAVTIGPTADGRLPVVVELENRGVAPFYYDWPVEFCANRGRQSREIVEGSRQADRPAPG